MVGRELAKLKEKYPALEIREVDVIAHPMQTIKSKIKMIPALKIGRTAKTIGFDPKSVSRFVEAHINIPT